MMITRKMVCTPSVAFLFYCLYFIFQALTMWIPALKLSIEHKEILQKKLWLDNCIINCAQKMLHHQFSNNSGLQSTLYVAAKQCSTLSGGAVQILHVRINHWLCIYVNDDKSVVDIYDSKYSSPIMTTVDLILELIKCEHDAVTINSIKMQEQLGSDACGLFAVAVATALCHKEDPSTIQWNQDLMWHHILQCFEAGKMTLFLPKGFAHENKRVIKSTRTFEIYCICRKRYRPKDTMKCCARCMKWYHVVCISASNTSTTSLIKHKAWYCSYCS